MKRFSVRTVIAAVVLIILLTGSCLFLLLQGGYYLHNCREGVSIGDIVFEDKFTEFRPLFNAEIIPCQNHNYRLIYEYELI